MQFFLQEQEKSLNCKLMKGYQKRIYNHAEMYDSKFLNLDFLNFMEEQEKTVKNMKVSVIQLIVKVLEIIKYITTIEILILIFSV